VTIWSIGKGSIREERSARRGGSAERTEQPSPEESIGQAFQFGLAVIGTLTFAALILLYVLLAYTDDLGVVQSLSLQVLIPFAFTFQLIGLSILVFSLLFFVSSIIVRTHAMASGKLVTWGPFRLVRHPSYFSYILMFIGLFLLWPNLLTVICLVGIPGYFGVASEEESSLASQFGAEYREYQKRTGRLFPKLRRRKPERSKH
jgi:protein-S-isoprenylcysteine O-methyltransferase Ste14